MKLMEKSPVCLYNTVNKGKNMFKAPKLLKKTFILILLACSVAGVLTFSGCTINGEPRVRLGSYATSTPGTNFLDLKNLGRHNYRNFLFEKNGIAYTCRGGHIDIAHVRIGADNVRWLYYKVRKKLMNDERNLTFKLNVEPSMYFINFEYPPDWNTLSPQDKKKIADEVALEMSQYLTFTMTTWHEVLTWFGYKCMAFLPEQPSAFSWEDIYSNLVGIRIGAQALKDEKHGYNIAVTIAIKKELEYLQVQSRRTARQAAEKMRGIWYDGIFLVDMRERNFDIGIDDGLVTPTLVPGVCEGAEPQSYPVPTLDKFYEYGFKMDFELEPKEFEKGKVLKIIYPNGNGKKRIRPAEHLPIMVNYIKDNLFNGSTLQNHTTKTN
jgi:hypothetical protein